MLTTLTIGVLASIAAEVINWVNKKLTNTVLHGKASFLLALVVSLIGAAIQVVLNGVAITDIKTLFTVFAEVWTVAQVFFVLIVTTLNLDVQDPGSSKGVW